MIMVMVALIGKIGSDERGGGEEEEEEEDNDYGYLEVFYNHHDYLD